MKYLVLVLKGMVYGLTHIAPGLGGALALIIMGIYEQFVDAVGNFFVDLFGKRERLREFLSFLVPLGAGMVLGMVVLAKLITVVLEHYPAATMFFFMGLVVGTIPSVWRMHQDMKPSAGRVIAFVIGVALVVATRQLEPSTVVDSSVASINSGTGMFYNLLVSLLAGGASVTPGLDGSYVLLLGGTYEAVLGAVSALTDLTIHLGALATTGVGAVAGIIGFAKLIDVVIKRSPSVAYYCILGLVVGSVYGLWPEEPAHTGIVGLILAFVVGGAIAWWMGRSEAKVEATA